MPKDSGLIIFLNGTSSSGKTTIANKLASRLPNFEHMAIDDYLRQDQELADCIKQRNAQGALETANRVVYNFHRLIACKAVAGHNTIVDHVLENPDWAEHAEYTLSLHRVLFIGVYCHLDVAVRRENERGDRISGTAQYQFPIVHANKSYDLRVDTSALSIKQCVDQIVDEIDRTQYSDRTAKRKFVLL